MTNCVLRNQPATARKINQGAEKCICAWIDCDTVRIVHQNDYEWCHAIALYNQGTPRLYNPRLAPHWRNRSGGNCDKEQIGTVVSFSTNLSAIA